MRTPPRRTRTPLRRPTAPRRTTATGTATASRSITASRPTVPPTDTAKPAPVAPASTFSASVTGRSSVAVAGPHDRDGVLELELRDRQVLRQVRPVDLGDRPDRTGRPQHHHQLLDGLGELLLRGDERI